MPFVTTRHRWPMSSNQHAQGGPRHDTPRLGLGSQGSRASSLARAVRLSGAVAAMTPWLVALAGCDVEEGCDQNEQPAPTVAPSKLPSNLSHFDAAVEREDENSICSDRADYVGACDDPCHDGGYCAEACRSLAWFCVEERLFVLDCRAVHSNGRCEERGATWTCVGMDDSSSDL